MRFTRYHFDFAWPMVVFIVLFACATAALNAAQPARFNYQAVLTDAGGIPLSGNHTVYISLFQGGNASAANSGVNVYSETAVVTFTAGVLNHSVGTGTPPSGTLTSNQLAFNGDLFLQVAVDSPANVKLPRRRLESVPFAIPNDQPSSLFGQFAGSGKDGSTTISGTQQFTQSRYEFQDLVIPAQTTATATKTHTFIGVKGICSIQGTLSAVGAGATGGTSQTAIGSGPTSVPGLPGYDATNARILETSITGCMSGAGGGGQGSNGGKGGGAGGKGGNGGAAGAPTPATRFAVVAMPQFGSGKTTTDNFLSLLKYPGAGGGSGYAQTVISADDMVRSGPGGAGGGVVYIECEELNFTGLIDGGGADGGNGVLLQGMGIGSGGGGGGGGIILVRARKIISKTGTADASGGLGGHDNMPFPATGFGAPGAMGFWDIVELP